MENQIPKTGNRKPARSKNKKAVSTTEAGNPVMFITIEEHNALMDEKVSQLISLENGLRASENSLEKANSKNLELKEEIRKLRQTVSNEYLNTSNYMHKLNKIPTWIKKLFNVA